MARQPHHHTSTPADDASLARLLDAHAEWFCTKIITGVSRAGERQESFALRRADCTLQTAGASLLFHFCGERGAEMWRVASWERVGEQITLHVARRMNREAARLELIPRAANSESVAHVREARLLRLTRFANALRKLILARDAATEIESARSNNVLIESARLSAGSRRGEPGRFARVRLATRAGRIFATGAVANAGDMNSEAFLAAALIWFSRRREPTNMKGGARADQLWLVASERTAERLAERCALLREEWQRLIFILTTNVEDDDFAPLASIEIPTPAALLNRAPRPLRARIAQGNAPSLTAERIINFAPEAITARPVRHGETLSFRGLDFARVRRLMNREYVWFGVESAACANSRQRLSTENETEFRLLIERLRTHRRADADDRRHAFYTARPEAWLESLLRRSITALDPGLVLAPVYAQLRVAPHAAGGRPVDLLARRRDGRLVVVELKTAEDAALPFQAADYWRQVEAHRRAGHLAALFGDGSIANAPPLLYVVAPTLRFAHSFPFLASLLQSQIEIYRFDINEDWRAGIRVQRRTRVSAAS